MCQKFKSRPPQKWGGKILKKFEANSRITRHPKSEDHIAKCSFIRVSWKPRNYGLAKYNFIYEGAALEQKLFSK